MQSNVKCYIIRKENYNEAIETIYSRLDKLHTYEFFNVMKHILGIKTTSNENPLMNAPIDEVVIHPIISSVTIDGEDYLELTLKDDDVFINNTVEIFV